MPFVRCMQATVNLHDWTAVHWQCEGALLCRRDSSLPLKLKRTSTLSAPKTIEHHTAFDEIRHTGFQCSPSVRAKYPPTKYKRFTISKLVRGRKTESEDYWLSVRNQLRYFTAQSLYGMLDISRILQASVGSGAEAVQFKSVFVFSSLLNS